MNLERGRNDLLAELEAAGAKVSNNAIRCPFHADKHPSGSIYQGKDGGWRYCCHGCSASGDLYDIRSLVTGKSRQELLREANGGTHQAEPKAPKVYSTLSELRLAVSHIGQIVAEYNYENAGTGKVELIVFRLEPKSFLQAHPVKSGYVMTAPPKPWPIFNQAAVKATEIIIITEGEKDCHTLAEYGLVGTTSPAGAGKGQYADWGLLAGKKVILWPDADEPGRKHMGEVNEIIQQLEPPPRVFMVQPGSLDLRNGEDVTDYVGQLKVVGTDVKQALEQILAGATECGVVGGLRQVLDDTISGKRQALLMPWVKLSELTLALLPGMVSIIAGAPGALKSFWLLQLLAFLYEGGVKVACYELEHDRTYHLNRLLAQRCGESNLLNPVWIRDNPGEVYALFEKHKTFLEGFGRYMWDAADKEMTLKSLAEWVKQRAEAGNRVIVLDPITIVERTQEPWIEDQRFLLSCKAAIRRYGASLIFATHPKKGNKGAMGLDDLAGGAAYQRFSQSIIWLDKFAEPKVVTIKGDCGRFVTEVNLSLHILKASNARGHGLRLGFVFNPATLQFAEQGLIITQKGETNE
jgi:hypothetical protein